MIPEFDKKSIIELKDLLAQPRKIVITTHYKPDGDAMGSSLALYHFLKNAGHEVSVVAPSDFPDFLDWMPGSELVVNFEHAGGKAKQLALEADLVFCLDFNTASRVEKFSEAIVTSNAKKVLIDHHLDPENFCDYTFSFAKIRATCELVYYFLIEMGGNTSITKEIAECLYTGVMTDTGSFRFSSMTADTHMVIAALMCAGASNFEIHENIYDNFSFDRTRFLGHCLKDKLVVLPEYRTAYIAVTKQELAQYNHHSLRAILKELLITHWELKVSSWRHSFVNEIISLKYPFDRKKISQSRNFHHNISRRWTSKCSRRPVT